MDEQDSMVIYQDTAGCRMEYITSVLDDETARACGRCDNCAGQWFPADIAAAATEAAGQTLSRAGVPLEPRLQWPSGMDRLGVPVKGKIKPEESVAGGRALARLTDLGWGGALREAFAAGAPDRTVDPGMLQACVQVLREWGAGDARTPGWSGAGRPAAIISVPSRGKPALVDSLARGISEIGRIPYLGQLQLEHGGPTGGRGGNSAYRLAGVWDRLVVGPELEAALAGHPGPERDADRRSGRQPLDRDRRRPGPQARGRRRGAAAGAWPGRLTSAPAWRGSVRLSRVLRSMTTAIARNAAGTVPPDPRRQPRAAQQRAAAS